MEKTLVFLKPDAVSRKLAGEIIARFEHKGFNILKMKMMNMTPELAKRHYAEHLEKSFFTSLLEYVTSGPIIVMILEGPEAVRSVRTLLGATNGIEAAPGTIRGDFSNNAQTNLVHASDSSESAEREIAIFFE